MLPSGGCSARSHKGPGYGHIPRRELAVIETSTLGLLAAYALGLGVPFVLSAVFMRELVGRLKVLRHAGRPLQVVARFRCMHAEMMQKMGEIAAKHADKIKEGK